MSESSQEFASLMERLREGSDEAAHELLETYGSHIYRAVRRRLNQQLRSRFDSQDFVQAVWASFFANRAAVANFDDPASLTAFLSRIAANKVIEECRRRMTSKKDNVNLERPTDAFGHPSDRNLPSADPTASQVAIANEQWDRLVAGQPARYQRMLELRTQGATFEEIATTLGVNEKTVRRIVQKLSDRIIS